MTDESPTPPTLISPEAATATTTTAYLKSSDHRHTHWITHVLLWVLGSATGVMGWKVVQLEQRTTFLEQRLNVIAQNKGQLTAPPATLIPSALTSSTTTTSQTTPSTSATPSSTDSSTPTSSPSLMNSTTTTSSSAPHTESASSQTNVPNPVVLKQAAPTLLPPAPSLPVPVAQLPVLQTTTLPINAASLPNLLSTAASSQFTDFIQRSSMTIAYTHYSNGNWETATTLLELLRNNSTGNPRSEIETIWRALHNQRPALARMEHQLHQLERQTATLALPNINALTKPVPISANAPLWLKLWTEVQEDLSDLIRVEPKNAASIRARNEIAFEWRAKLITALRNYHLAWKKGDHREQERLEEYIDNLLNYAFDANSPTVKEFKTKLKNWTQQPPLLRVKFPRFVEEDA
ncbi:MAG: hypothetical protein V4525_09040 [Pseudomonadota bacterium]